MTREKRGRGRPPKYVLPPRIDATAEEVARAVLQVKPKDTEPESFLPVTHRCEGCGRVVEFPEIYYTDRRCKDCTDPHEVVRLIRRRRASIREG